MFFVTAICIQSGQDNFKFDILCMASVFILEFKNQFFNFFVFPSWCGQTPTLNYIIAGR